MAKFERNRILPPEPKSVPSSLDTIAPTLRFMLAPEVLEDGERFYRHINNRVSWSNLPDHLLVGFMEKHIIGKLPDEWPQVARVNEHFGGLLVEVLRAFAANPKLPGWWKSPFITLARGHPEGIRSACERVLGDAGVPLPEVETYEEEKPDIILREAARHWQDRDSDEFERDLV